MYTAFTFKQHIGMTSTKKELKISA